ncbi:MAG: tetratricopeptide repeat protein, partial [Steroidobacteraceae bacterium]
PLAWSLPSGALTVPPAAGTTPQAAHDAAAVEVYNAGVKLLAQADKLDSEAATRSGRAGASLEKRADAQYRAARAKFKEATQKDMILAEAWNNLGYTRRKLGDYEAALDAYARALALKPGYPQALEYRGETYLKMHRLGDAKQAYMDLFVTDRAVAKHFLGEMKHWIATQTSATGASAAAVKAFAKWVAKRSEIAAQTVALTRAGTATAWDHQRRGG